MDTVQKSALVVTAHPGDFVWRAGGAIALHAELGYRVKIVCLSFGERGESQFAWKKRGVILDEVKAQRREEADRAAAVLGAEIEHFDGGDQPEQCNFKPDLLLKIDSVWERKRAAFEVLTAQKHLWDYYTRVALNRGVQGGRNSGIPMTYAEAYQRLFPSVVGEMAS